jgi:hypothetical protein
MARAQSLRPALSGGLMCEASAQGRHAAEVRYRPPVHRMTEDLLWADNRSALPGLRDFARRVGVPGH